MVSIGFGKPWSAVELEKRDQDRSKSEKRQLPANRKYADRLIPNCTVPSIGFENPSICVPYFAEYPPSITRFVPVTNAEAGLAR